MITLDMSCCVKYILYNEIMIVGNYIFSLDV